MEDLDVSSTPAIVEQPDSLRDLVRKFSDKEIQTIDSHGDPGIFSAAKYLTDAIAEGEIEL